MVEISQEAQESFNNPEAVRVVATVDEQGNPHAVPVGSLQFIGNDTFAFAVVALKKTKENLEKTKKAALLSFTMFPKPGGYKVDGTFVRFETEGKLFDTFASVVKEKLGVHITHVGIIKAESFEPISLEA